MTNTEHASPEAADEVRVQEMSDAEWDAFIKEDEIWFQEHMEKVARERAAINRAREEREKKWSLYVESDEYKESIRLWQENRV
tara:strand:- start:163 stop:411 length:249 start_codon:yes stop_codon:yes gene_type:complete